MSDKAFSAGFFHKPAIVILLSIYMLALTTSLAAIQILNAVIFLLFLANVLVNKRLLARKWDAFTVFVIGFLFIFFVFSYLSPANIGFIQSLLNSRWITITAALAYFLNKYESYQKDLFFILCVCTCLVGVYSLVHFLVGKEWLRPDALTHTIQVGQTSLIRVRGTFSHVMSYSYTMGMVFTAMLAGTMLRVSEKKYRTLFFSATLFMGLIVILTFTRGVWISCVLAALFMSLLISRKFFLKFGLGIAVCLSLIVIAFPGVKNRVDSMVGGKLDESMANRVVLWRSNWNMFLDHPILGVGWGNNKKLIPEYNISLTGQRGFVGEAHSNYLEVLAGSGAIIFMLWLLILSILIYRSYLLYKRSLPDQKWMAFVGLASFGVHIFFHVGGITQSSFFDKEPLFTYMFFCALQLAQWNSYELKNKNQNIKK